MASEAAPEWLDKKGWRCDVLQEPAAWWFPPAFTIYLTPSKQLEPKKDPCKMISDHHLPSFYYWEVKPPNHDEDTGLSFLGEIAPRGPEETISYTREDYNHWTVGTGDFRCFLKFDSSWSRCDIPIEILIIEQFIPIDWVVQSQIEKGILVVQLGWGPPPGNSGKWRFVGISYKQCSHPCGDCYWEGARPKL